MILNPARAENPLLKMLMRGLSVVECAMRTCGVEREKGHETRGAVATSTSANRIGNSNINSPLNPISTTTPSPHDPSASLLWHQHKMLKFTKDENPS
jgi:hypothetical protein